MRILPMRISEWMEVYNTGFGLMGEQGTEAIHAHFHKLYRAYGSMVNKVQRMKCIMQEHYLPVCPRLKSMRPEKQVALRHSI